MGPRSDRAPALDPSESLEARPLSLIALGGVLWHSAGSVVLIVVQIASTAATARLVSPSEFGLYATAQAAAGLAGYFTLSALGAGIQRRTELGRGTIGTALLLSLISSLVVGGVLFGLAGPWARAWGLPEAAATVRIVAVGLLITSAAAIPLALIRRELRFRMATVIETSSQVVAMGSGVALAAHEHTAQALAAGQVLGAVVLLAVGTAASARRLHPRFDGADARELLTFSSQVNGLGFLAYLSISAPAWFVARFFGSVDLGVYSRAALVIGIPATYAMVSIFKALYPLYGRVRDDLSRTRSLISEALSLTTGMAWSLFALVAGGAPVIVSVLLGSRWDEAANLLPLFTLAACAYIPCGLLTNAAEAMGWIRIIAVREIGFLVGTAIGLVVAYAADLSVVWILAIVAAAQWATYALTLEPFLRRGILDARAVGWVHLVHGATALALFGAAAVCAAALDSTALIVQMAGQLVVGALALAAIIRGRSWMPAMQVLARRLGVLPDQNILRTGLKALRS